MELFEQIKDMGFSPEMFNKTEDIFGEYIQSVIDIQAPKVKARIGAVLYAATGDIAIARDDAVVALTVAELWERRKIQVLGAVSFSGDQRNRAGLSEENSRDRANEDFEAAVGRVFSLAGVTPDLSVGAVVSSHFLEASL